MSHSKDTNNAIAQEMAQLSMQSSSYLETDPNSPDILSSIPLETRQMIIKQLLNSTMVRHGFGTTSTTNTSVLRVNRQFYTESKELMARSIGHHFQSTEAMLDYLTTLSTDAIAQLRRIRVKGFPVPLYTSLNPDHAMAFHSYTTYSIGSVIALFPGLQLDLLVVEDCYHDEGVNDGWGDCGTYNECEALIKSNGWKELHFITPTTEFITSRNDEHEVRVTQPAGWDKLLRDKDGEGAEVTMYVARELGVSGMAKDPTMREAYSAVPSHITHGSAIVKGPGYSIAQPMTSEDEKREVLVVAKRGINAAYVEYGRKVHSHLKALFERMSWKEVKEAGRHVPPQDHPCAHL